MFDELRRLFRRPDPKPEFRRAVLPPRRNAELERLGRRDDSQIRLERDRYDPHALMRSLHQQQLKQEDGRWMCTLETRDGELDVFLPDEGGRVSGQALELLRDVLLHICDLDNSVQESCEQNAAASQCHLDNFKLHIGYIDLTGKTTRLRYYGTIVNTEWDAEFSREDTKWKPHF